MSWKRGYDSIDSVQSSAPKKGPGRFYVPARATKQVLFLEDQPTVIWEHQFKFGGSWLNWLPCNKNNSEGQERCFICEKYTKSFPATVGLYSIINLTPLEFDSRRTGKKVVLCYRREIFTARMGSVAKPGVLRELQRLRGMTENKSLHGVVMECHRSGDKTSPVGDKLAIKTVVPPEKIEEFGHAKVRAFLAEINKGVAPDSQISFEEFIKRNPWKPFDFDNLIMPMPYERQRKMYGWDSAPDEPPQAGTPHPADNPAFEHMSDDFATSGGFSDEEIPF
jgi:hypothetical protein